MCNISVTTEVTLCLEILYVKILKMQKNLWAKYL